MHVFLRVICQNLCGFCARDAQVAATPDDHSNGNTPRPGTNYGAGNTPPLYNHRLPPFLRTNPSRSPGDKPSLIAYWPDTSAGGRASPAESKTARRPDLCCAPLGGGGTRPAVPQARGYPGRPRRNRADGGATLHAPGCERSSRLHQTRYHGATMHAPPCWMADRPIPRLSLQRKARPHPLLRGIFWQKR